jgi:hypothetical protein
MGRETNGGIQRLRHPIERCRIKLDQVRSTAQATTRPRTDSRSRQTCSHENSNGSGKPTTKASASPCRRGPARLARFHRIFYPIESEGAADIQ